MTTTTTTTTALPPPRIDVSTLVALRRATAAEWSRLWSVRSTWLALLAALGISVMMGVVFGLDFEDEDIPVWAAGEFIIVVVQFPLLAMVMLQVTAEYATGAIRSSLQAVPRRGVLLAARTGVAVTVATIAGVLAALAADLTAWLWLRDEVVVTDLAGSLADVAVVVAAGALVTTGIATILRSTAGTLTTIFLVMLVLPMMLPEFGATWLATVGESLPGMAIALLEAMQFDDDRSRLIVVLLAWTIGTTAVGAWLFARRDAT